MLVGEVRWATTPRGDSWKWSGGSQLSVGVTYCSKKSQVARASLCNCCRWASVRSRLLSPAPALLLLLLAVFGATLLLVPHPEPTALPDTPQGKHVRAYVDAVNFGDVKKYLAMIKTHLAPSIVAKRTPEQHTEMFERVRGDFDSLRITRVTPYVTVILDCCHSGTAVRSERKGPKVRRVPPDRRPLPGPARPRPRDAR